MDAPFRSARRPCHHPRRRLRRGCRPRRISTRPRRTAPSGSFGLTAQFSACEPPLRYRLSQLLRSRHHWGGWKHALRLRAGLTTWCTRRRERVLAIVHRSHGPHGHTRHSAPARATGTAASATCDVLVGVLTFCACGARLITKLGHYKTGYK